MTEQEANLCMVHIVALESNPFSKHNRAVLKHLHKLHKLRDWHFYLEATKGIRDPKEWEEMCDRMREM